MTFKFSHPAAATGLSQLGSFQLLLRSLLLVAAAEEVVVTLRHLQLPCLVAVGEAAHRVPIACMQLLILDRLNPIP